MGIDLEDEISLEMDTPGQGERVVDADGFFGNILKSIVSIKNVS